jgi:hypothetical protein
MEANELKERLEQKVTPEQVKEAFYKVDNDLMNYFYHRENDAVKTEIKGSGCASLSAL